MKDVVRDTKYRVFMVQVWGIAGGAHASGALPLLVGCQVVYQHETTRAVVRGPVVGAASEPHHERKRLPLYTGDYVTRVTATDGVLRIQTMSQRELRCRFASGVVGTIDAGCELRALSTLGDDGTWSIQVHGAKTPDQCLYPLLPPSVAQTYSELVARMSTKFTRSVKLWFQRSAVIPRAFGMYDLVMRLDPRQVDKATQSLVKDLDTVLMDLLRRSRHKPRPIVSTVNYVEHVLSGCESLLRSQSTTTTSTALVVYKKHGLVAKMHSIDQTEATIRRCEERIDELLTLDTTDTFGSALGARDCGAVVALIQWSTHMGRLNRAAQMCISAAQAGVDVKSQVTELVLERLDVSDQAIFDAVRSRKSSICTVLRASPALVSKGRAALHAAIAEQSIDFAHLLVAEIGVALFGTTAIGARACELVERLSCGAKSDGEIAQTLDLLTRYTRAIDFQRQLHAVLASGTVTYASLLDLATTMSAVEDLQVIVSLGVVNLAPHAFHDLLEHAFEHILAHKLVFDTDALVYFVTAIKHCKDKRHLTDLEAKTWRVRAAHVNMESAPWVTEMKWTLKTMQTQLARQDANVQILAKHYEALQRVLAQQQASAQAQGRVNLAVSLLAMAFVAVGGPPIGALVKHVVDLSDASALLESVTMVDEGGKDPVTTFCATTGATAVFKAGIELILQRAGIAPIEFATALKSAVILEHPELVPPPAPAPVVRAIECSASTSASEHSVHLVGWRARVQAAALALVCSLHSALMRTLAPTLEFPKHGHALRQQLARVSLLLLALAVLVALSGTDPSRDQGDWTVTAVAAAPSAHDFAAQDLEASPYHYAIQQSHGDLDTWRTLLADIAVGSECDINKAHDVIVRVPSTGAYERKALPPHVFASYLGYVAILEDLRQGSSSDSALAPAKRGEHMVVTMNRARKVAQAMAAPSD